MTNLTTLASEIHADNRAKGFWDRERPLTETTMLIVTELAEAVEEERAGRPAVWYRDNGLSSSEDPAVGPEHLMFVRGVPYHEEDFDVVDEMPDPLKPEGIDIELIDALIRLLDLLGSRDVDVDALLKQKLAYNASRPARHGKAY